MAKILNAGKCPEINDMPYVQLSSPTKNFNIAGLQISNIICPSEEWLSQMNAYIYENYILLRDTMKKELGLTVCELQGTYLAWLDCQPLGISTDLLQERLTDRFGVWINGGSMYADARYMRINLATSHAFFREGLNRIIAGLKA